MRYLLLLLLLGCSPKSGHKQLYRAEVKIEKLDNSLDTIDIVYFDYIILDLDHVLYKKDGKIIEKNVKKYKILKKSKVKL